MEMDNIKVILSSIIILCTSCAPWRRHSMLCCDNDILGFFLWKLCTKTSSAEQQVFLPSLENSELSCSHIPFYKTASSLLIVPLWQGRWGYFVWFDEWMKFAGKSLSFLGKWLIRDAFFSLISHSLFSQRNPPPKQHKLLFSFFVTLKTHIFLLK